MGGLNLQNHLFSGFELHSTLQAQRNQVVAEINALDANRILNTAPEDLTKHYVDKNFIETPALHRNEWVVDSTESNSTVNDFGRAIKIAINVIEVELPFDGEGRLFQAQPSTRSPLVPGKRCQGQFSWKERGFSLDLCGSTVLWQVPKARAWGASRHEAGSVKGGRRPAKRTLELNK
ncbi:MAG: hypothetical protein ABI389_15350 [Rhodanobacter sp.]